MKNPFRFFRSSAEKPAPQPSPAPAAVPEAPAPQPTAPTEEPAPADPFIEWCRTRVQGGIERRERNDIYEAYSVYGTDDKAQLICRYFHRYPEHERDFDLSYSRALTFSEFNKRLLSELDKGSLTLLEYHACIEKAASLTSAPSSDTDPYTGFSEGETAALHAFCDGMDILTDREYRHAEGVFRCSCRSAVGDDALTLWFRKPLAYDALDGDVAGVGKTPVESYDISDLWIMGVCNRLREHCQSCRVTLLTSEWSLDHESVYLIAAEGFQNIPGTLLLAVSDSAAFARFGFFSLDFSRK